MHSSQKHFLLPIKELFTNKKIIENHFLNYAGAQIFRVLLSSAAYSCRRMLQSWPSTDLTTMLRKNGFIIIPKFLRRNDFQKVKYEFFNKAKSGFYSPIKDGDTKVERYTFSFDKWQMLPAVKKLLSDKLLLTTLGGVELENVRIGDIWFDTIYYDDSQNMDSSQNQLHSDTFYNTHKVWFFIEPVSLEDGPLCFVPGSNHLTIRHLIFEYLKSIRFDKLTPHERRVLTKNEKFLDYKEETLACLDNTLIIANTRGFHRRGNAKAGHSRKQIHFCIRTKNPFSFY